MIFSDTGLVFPYEKKKYYSIELKFMCLLRMLDLKVSPTVWCSPSNFFVEYKRVINYFGQDGNEEFMRFKPTNLGPNITDCVMIPLKNGLRDRVGLEEGLIHHCRKEKPRMASH